MPRLNPLRFWLATAGPIVVFLIMSVLPVAAQEGRPESLTNARIAWSPDGDRLAFVANWGGDEELYVVRKDGSSDPIQLTDNDRYDANPVFSADGRSVLYTTRLTRAHDKKDLDIFIIGLGGGEPRHYFGREQRSELWPQIMADGRLSVSVVTSPGVLDIIAVDVASGTEQILIASKGRDGWGAFSRNGRRLVYTSNRLGGGAKFDIYVADANGANDRYLKLYPLGVNGYGSVFPHFYPDGERFIYWSDKDGFEPGDNYHYVYDLRHGTDERLPRPDGAVIGNPSVSPDGKTIAFTADYNGDGTRVISLMDVSTRKVRYLPVVRPPK